MAAPTNTIPYTSATLVTSALGTYHMGIQVAAGVAGMRYIELDNFFKLREQIGFNTTAPDGTTTKGSLVWNTVDDTLELILANSVRATLGESAFIPYEASESIAKGQLVMRTAAIGTTGKIIGSKAVTDGTYDSNMILGIAMETLTVGNWGRAANLGRVKSFNTNAWAVGSTLYSNPASPGGLTATPQVAPNNKTPIAVVVTQHVSTGIIQLLTPSGLAFEKIDDVVFASLADEDIVTYDVATGTWKNSTRLTDVEDEVDVLNGIVTTPGSVLKMISDEAEDAVFTPSGTISAVKIKTAIAELDTEKESIANVDTLKGVGWVDETVKGNADDIVTVANESKELVADLDISNSREHAGMKVLALSNSSATYNGSDLTNFASQFLLGYDFNLGQVVANGVITKGLLTLMMKGRSWQNQAEADDVWATALTGWTSADDSIVDSKYRLTKASDATGERDISTILDVTKYWFVSTYGTSNTDTAGGKFDVLEDTGGAVIASSGVLEDDNTETIGLILQPSDLTGHTPHLLMTHKGSGYTEWNEFNIVEITSAEYALGLADMLIKYPYVNGLASTLTSLVTRVGVNLIDPSKITLNHYISVATGGLGYHTVYMSSDYTRFDTSLGLYFDTLGNRWTTAGIGFYDKDKVFISAISITSIDAYYRNIIPTPSNAIFFRNTFSTSRYPTPESALVVHGTTYKAHEAYDAISAYNPLVMRSVPDGTQDDLETQKNSVYTITADDVIRFDPGTFTNGVSINKPSDFIGAGLTAAYGLKIAVEGWVSTNHTNTGLDNVANIGILTPRSNVSYITFILDLADPLITDLASAKTEFTGVEIIYTLLTEVPRENPLTEITTDADSTLQIEPYLQDIFTSDSSGDIDLGTNYASRIAKVERYDETGITDVTDDASLTDSTTIDSGTASVETYAVYVYLLSENSTIAETETQVPTANLNTKVTYDVKTVTVVNVATYDTVITDNVLLVSYTSTAAMTSLTLTSAMAEQTGRIITIKDSGNNANTNNITIDTEAAGTIDGAATLVMNVDLQTVRLITDGVDWHVI